MRKTAWALTLLLLIFWSVAPCALAWRSALYPEDWQSGDVSDSGLFLHDFSYAGYRMGEEAIPETRAGLYIDVTKPPYACDNTGAEDVTDVIQAALDAVGASGGGTVYLPAGTYRISPRAGENYALRLSYENVTLRGAGADQTFFYNSEYNMRQKCIFSVGAGGNWLNAADGVVRPLAREVSAAPTNVVYARDVSGLSVGDWIVLRADMSEELISSADMGNFWSASISYGLAFYRQITSVDERSGAIGIDIPTRYAMLLRDNARLYKAQPMLTGVGLEDFAVGNRQYPASASDTAQFGANTYLNAGTAAYKVHGSNAIALTYCRDCWISGVSSYRPGINKDNVHLVSNGIFINECRSITVENCTISYPQYRGGGGNGYGYTISSADCLLTGCAAISTRHGFSFKNMYATGNVIYDFTSKSSLLNCDFHMRLSAANLIDSAKLYRDYIDIKPRKDGGGMRKHGQTSSQSVVWNARGTGYSTGSPYALVQSRQFGQGYVIGTSGSAYQVTTQPVTAVTPFGNVRTAPEDWKEGVGKGATLEPQSLYLDQLARRLSGS